MKKRYRRKSRRLLVLLILIVLVAIVVTMLRHIFSFFNGEPKAIVDFSSIPEYDTIKLDNNENYAGIGQKKVENKNGYFTTFTGIDNKVYKEFKQNGSAPWANKKYWDGDMNSAGCGITAMSIILSGYNIDYTPEDLREKYYPVLNGENISYELSHSFGISNSDFLYDSVSLSEKNITEHLRQNRPVLICVWNKPTNNRWTTASHYMVLLATDNNNMVYVSNPNGLDNNSKSSGWYDFKEVGPYIAKALFINE